MSLHKIEDIFSTGGVLSKVLAPQHEWRPQQGEMAAAVYRTLDLGGRLLVEAPTGVGKSLAYLVPGVLWAFENRSPLLISTFTRALQDQILQKDLPHMQRMVDREIRAIVLKGRGNYLCRTRWNHYLDEVRGTPEGEDLEKALGRWVEFTETGDLSEAPVPAGKAGARVLAAFGRISSEGRFCTAARCTAEGGCFFKLSRQRARDAHVLIVNHALLMIDLFSGAAGLPDWNAVILDEAHHIPRAAAEPLSFSSSEGSLDGALKALGGRGEPGMTDQLRKSLRDLGDRDERSNLLAGVREIEAETVRLSTLARSFWVELDTAAAQHSTGTKTPANARFTPRQELRIRYGPHATVREDFLPATGLDLHAALTVHLDRITELLERTRHARRAAEDEEMFPVLEAEAAADGARTEIGRLGELLSPTRSGFVYWVEPAAPSGPALRAAPIEVGPELRDALFRRKTAVIATSATLAVSGSFEHFGSKLGLDEGSYEGLLLSTPFQLDEQVGAFVLCGTPGPNEPGFARFLAQGIFELAHRLRRKTLVLFTAHETLRAVEAAARPRLEERGIRMHAQGLDGGQGRVKAGFREQGPAVLLGTAGFWEGIDFPGEELEVLLMARLPFPVPSDPLVQAMDEKLRAEGEDPFRKFHLPEALIRFRQGFGRLIRRRGDRGLFIVADPRLHDRPYGKLFEEAVGVRFREAGRWEDLAAAGGAWFKGPAGNEGADP